MTADYGLRTEHRGGLKTSQRSRAARRRMNPRRLARPTLNKASEAGSGTVFGVKS